MRALALWGVILAAGCGAAPGASSDDLRALSQFIAEVHPRPFAYVERGDFDALVEAEAARMDAIALGRSSDAASDQETQLEVALSMHRILAPLGDGHLAIALPIFDDVESLIPLLIRRAGASFFVDACAEPLPRGTVIERVDGEAIEALWAELEALVLADGRGESARTAQLERSFGRYFHVLRGLRAEYAIDVRLPDGTTRALTLRGVDRDATAALGRARFSARTLGAPSTETPPWPFVTETEGGATLLRLPSFGIADREGYEARVAALMAGIDPDGTLILDLRGNEGGLRTHGVAVLNHLVSAPYAQWRAYEARVRAIPDPFRSLITFPFVPESGLTFLFGDAPLEAGAHRVEGDYLAELMHPASPMHRGPVIALSDGLTNSAAVEMITALRAARPDAILRGIETGGECGRHVGEMPVMFTGPSTGVRVLVSLVAITHVATEGCLEGRGHLPDQPVVYTEADFMGDRDPFLEGL